jgi:hypothetical protein
MQTGNSGWLLEGKGTGLRPFIIHSLECWKFDTMNRLLFFFKDEHVFLSGNK